MVDKQMMELVMILLECIQENQVIKPSKMIILYQSISQKQLMNQPQPKPKKNVYQKAYHLNFILIFLIIIIMDSQNQNLQTLIKILRKNQKLKSNIQIINDGYQVIQKYLENTHEKQGFQSTKGIRKMTPTENIQFQI
ncbi:unnamed protein product [Paramecium sonneborni]|uniref:Transmembrane protein n=1 Tax=Paramecium sonneborni TaxID=65129 RepID=A0A8S1RQ94_9CILI|nr:unnamed protein product [Paramecium sonneborni]